MSVRPTMSLRADAPQPVVLCGARVNKASRNGLFARCASTPALADGNGGTHD